MALTRGMRDRLVNLALALATLCLTFLFLEGAFRVFGVGDRERSQSADLHVVDPQLGWANRPNASIRLTSSEFDVVQTTNAQGLRGPERAIPKPDGVRRVLMIGDSFLEGRGVADDSVVSHFLQQELDRAATPSEPVEVVNGGTTGYSTDQELLFLRSRGLAFEPDVTVLIFYLNDISMNAQAFYRGEVKPSFRIDPDGSLTQVETSSDPAASEAAPDSPRGVRRVAAWFGAHSNFYRWFRAKTFRDGALLYRFAPGSQYGRLPVEWAGLQSEPDSTTVRAWRLTEALLAAIRDEAEAAGSRFLVFYAPSLGAVRDDLWEETARRYGVPERAYRPDRDAEGLAEICERRGLQCIIDIEAFRQAERAADPPGLYYPADTHWTPSGHALAARLIAAAVAPLLFR